MLFPDKSMVSNLGNDENASRGRLSMELSANIKRSSEPSNPENESNSMQSIWFPLKSKYFNFFKLRKARDGTSTNWLWWIASSHSERSRPSNALSGISPNGLYAISMR